MPLTKDSRPGFPSMQPALITDRASRPPSNFLPSFLYGIGFSCSSISKRSRSLAQTARDFGRRLPRSKSELTPSKRLKLSSAGPMVLHAPSVRESRLLPARIKSTFGNELGVFRFGAVAVSFAPSGL